MTAQDPTQTEGPANGESQPAPAPVADTPATASPSSLTGPPAPHGEPRRWEWGVALLLCVCSLTIAWVVTSISPELMPPSHWYKHTDHLENYTGYHALMRWDGDAYLEIMTDGYSYNGKPKEFSNIVFSPGFPVIATVIAALTPLDALNAGFLWNHLAFVVGTLLAFYVMYRWCGALTAWLTVFGLCFSAGSFAFHAFYSESTMLLFLMLALYCYQRDWFWGLIASLLLLGATRPTAVPFCIAFSLWCVWRAWQRLRAESPGRLPATAKYAAGIPLMYAGMAAYLAYIGYHYGNPIQTIKTVQDNAWGGYHQPVSMVELFTLHHIRDYWCQAVDLNPRWWRHSSLESLWGPSSWWYHHKNVNLLWTTIAGGAAWYGAWRLRRWWPVALGFLGYAGMIYLANVGSPFLISTHRFFVMMLPIYVMLGDGLGALIKNRLQVTAGILIALWCVMNLAHYVVYLIFIERGIWFYF